MTRSFVDSIPNKYPLPDYTPDIANVPNDAKIIFKNRIHQYILATVMHQIMKIHTCR